MSDANSANRAYRLVFEVPVMAQFEIIVSADGQQQALIDGHDALLQSPLSTGRIINVSFDDAVNVGMELVEENTRGVMQDVSDQYEVQLFYGATQKTLARSLKFANEAQAESYAKDLMVNSVDYLQARVNDPQGQMVLRIASKRGGHEIRYNCAKSGESVVISNLTINEALRKVMDLKNAHQAAYFEIFKIHDTDRSIKPILVTKVE